MVSAFACTLEPSSPPCLRRDRSFLIVSCLAIDGSICGLEVTDISACVLCDWYYSISDVSKSEIGAPDFGIVNEVPGEAAVNDATGFHDVTSIGN